MNRHLRLLCLAISLWSCQSQSAETTPPPAESYPGNRLDWRHGRQVYRAACAGCHEQGKENAPRLRDAETWQHRSFSAFAVMTDHAKNGFLRMPAKGGQPHLQQPDVADAVFYMTRIIQKNAGADKK